MCVPCFELSAIWRILTCGVGRSTAPRHNSESTVSAWAPTGGSASPRPRSWAGRSWSRRSRRRPAIWARRGRRGGGTGERRWCGSRWHRGASPPCSGRVDPRSSRTASSSRSGSETGRDWPAASVFAEPNDHQPEGEAITKRLLKNIVFNTQNVPHIQMNLEIRR